MSDPSLPNPSLPERGAFGQQPQQPSDPTTPIPAVPQPSQPSAQTPRPPAYGGAANPSAPFNPTQSTGPANPQGPRDSADAVLTDSAGFLPALFDFSFTHFVTPKLVRFVYLLATIGLGLLWFIALIAAFADSATRGIGVLILGPIVLVIYLALIRMTLEFYLSIVRMSEDIHTRLPSA